MFDLMQYALIFYDFQLILARMLCRLLGVSMVSHPATGSTSRQRGRAAQRDRLGRPRGAQWHSVAQLAAMARP